MPAAQSKNRFIIIESGRFEVHFDRPARDHVATSYVHDYRFPTWEAAVEWAKEHRVATFTVAQVLSDPEDETAFALAKRRAGYALGTCHLALAHLSDPAPKVEDARRVLRETIKAWGDGRAPFVPFGPWPCCEHCHKHDADFPGHKLPCDQDDACTLRMVNDAMATLKSGGEGE